MNTTVKIPKLINIAYLKAYSPLPENYNFEEVMNYVPIAEELHIVPILGLPLYNELLDQVQENEVTELNSTLLIEIYKVLGPATVYESLPFCWSHISEVGIQLGKSDNSDSIDLKSLKYISEHLAGIVEFNKKSLIDFLEKYQTLYPLYQESVTCSCNNTKQGVKLTNFIHSNSKYNKTRRVE